MKRTASIGVSAFIALASVGTLPENALAVPSFARQVGKPCSACHTIWPRLNATGREFKEMGYTDVGDDYPRIEGDNLDLLRFGPPISVSVISFPYSNKKVTDEKGVSETRIPDEVAFFFAGRVTPNLGAFVEPHWERDTDKVNVELAKFSAATRMGSNTLGIVVTKGDVAAADPYNTIRFSAFHTINSPAIFFDTGARVNATTGASGDLFSFANTDNQGAVVNGKFFNSLYLAAGAFKGDGGAENPDSDPADGFARAAFEYPISGESIASIGGFYYGGKERYVHPETGEYESNLARYGVDFQYQMESAPHIIDLVAVYMGGKDKNVWDGSSTGDRSDVQFNGYYAEASYFYDRTYGLTVGYDYLKSDDDESIDKQGATVNLTYLPWLNTKIGIEYSHFLLADDVKEDDTNVLLHFYF